MIDTEQTPVDGAPPSPKKDPREYPGTLTPFAASIDRTSETAANEVWKRTHEKKRLRAYLAGKERFAHGRRPAYPVGYVSIMWPVKEKQEA